MALTTTDDTFNPQILSDTVQGHMTGKNALKGSMMIASGAAISEPSFTGGRGKLGTAVDIPYFGTIGEFQENLADGAAAVPRAIAMTSEQGIVTRDSLAFEATTWSRTSASADPYDEAARIIVVAAERQMDKRCIDAAVAPGVITNTTGADIAYNATIDSKFRFNDEQEDVVAMVVHSQIMADLLKLADTQGRPLLVDSQQDGGFQTFAGMMVGTSDRVDISGSTQGTVVASGGGPAVTLAGTPKGAYTLVIEIVAGGALGVGTFRFSTDGGDTFSDTHTLAASILLDESPGNAGTLVAAADSLVGVNGATGITATFAAGTYVATETYSSKTNLLASSLILKRNSIAWWWNRAELAMQTDTDILQDSQLAAMHLYGVAKRYRRRPGGSQTGVVSMITTQSEFDGSL